MVNSFLIETLGQEQDVCVKTVTPVIRVDQMTRKRTALGGTFCMRAGVVHVRIESSKEARLRRERAGKRGKISLQETSMLGKLLAACMRE